SDRQNRRNEKIVACLHSISVETFVSADQIALYQVKTGVCTRSLCEPKRGARDSSNRRPRGGASIPVENRHESAPFLKETARDRCPPAEWIVQVCPGNGSEACK